MNCSFNNFKWRNENVTKIVKSIEQAGLLIKVIIETIKNSAKEQKGGLLGMFLGALAASMLGSALTRRRVLRAGEGIIRAGENF